MIVLLGVLAYVVRRREGGTAGMITGDGGDPGDGSSGAGDALKSAGSEAPESPGSEPPGSTDGPVSEGAGSDGSKGTAAGGAAVTAAAGGDGEAGGDEETGAPLLSDEEQVLTLLRKNDGRMKQAEIVDATDWSNAKVSQLLSGMAESDEILKLRIGRENLITLPEEAPEGAE
jgi:uncharacterized membrane protein